MMRELQGQGKGFLAGLLLSRPYCGMLSRMFRSILSAIWKAIEKVDTALGVYGWFGPSVVGVLMSVVAGLLRASPVFWIPLLLGCVAFGIGIWNGISAAIHPSPRIDKLDRQRRIQLIRAWRDMVIEVNKQYRKQDLDDKNFMTVTALLESRRDFPSFRPHMSKRTRDTVWGRTFVVPPDQSTMEGGLHCILQDIDEVENKWGLR